MTVGLRVRDVSTGQVTVEVTDRLTRVIGTFNTGTASGSLTVSDFSSGSGWACILEAPRPSLNIANNYRYPRVRISGDVISWDFPGPYASWLAVACDVIYGVY
nr:MAG TPA_asm: hypothetical protein [Bacteriophage sp.]